MSLVHRTLRRRQLLDAATDEAIMCSPAAVVETPDAADRCNGRPCDVEEPWAQSGLSTTRNVIFATAWRAVDLRAFASGQRHAQARQ